ncbi:MAG: hypothetical protein GFH24_608346n23 [Chloroflexi bacterium AL-N5]|nr:hypothetical protein [Chloroflexi bacterium AL-N5]
MGTYKVTIIRNSIDVVVARTIAREMVKRAGFGVIDQAQIATAINNLTHGFFLHTKAGTVKLRTVVKDGNHGIEMLCENAGVNIDAISKYICNRYTWSTKTDHIDADQNGEFQICSQNEAGTSIRYCKWLAS